MAHRKFHCNELTRLNQQLQAFKRKVEAYIEKESAVYKAHTLAWAESEEGREARNAIMTLHEVKGHLSSASDKLLQSMDFYMEMRRKGNA